MLSRKIESYIEKNSVDNADLRHIIEAVGEIKQVIIVSRYRAAQFANKEMLCLGIVDKNSW